MKNLCFFYKSLMTGLLSATTMYADNNIITNTVLNVTDILGLEINYCSTNHWLSVDDFNNPTIIKNPALRQAAILSGVEVKIQYSEFVSLPSHTR